LISFRVGFHRKSCAWGVFVRVSFFVNLLTVSGSLDPRSARAGAVETQFLNLRIIVKKCNFCILFLHILRHLDLISFARNACKNKGKKKQEISFNLGPKTGPKKVVFQGVFGVWFRRFSRVVPRAFFWCPWVVPKVTLEVRQGGPKWSFWCPWVVPKVSPSAPKDTKSKPL